jgi:hypothetical protein
MTLIGGPGVPRWVLRDPSGRGYLTDERADVISFSAHPRDARHFYLKRVAEKISRLYALEIIPYPSYISNTQARSAKAGAR